MILGNVSPSFPRNIQVFATDPFEEANAQGVGESDYASGRASRGKKVPVLGDSDVV
jgi:hypothetical protein